MDWFVPSGWTFRDILILVEGILKAAVGKGGKIYLIKEIRAVTGWSLRGAKDFADALFDKPEIAALFDRKQEKQELRKFLIYWNTPTDDGDQENFQATVYAPSSWEAFNALESYLTTFYSHLRQKEARNLSISEAPKEQDRGVILETDSPQGWVRY